mgnify:CR=1 FL=1
MKIETVAWILTLLIVFLAWQIRFLNLYYFLMLIAILFVYPLSVIVSKALKKERGKA